MPEIDEGVELLQEIRQGISSILSPQGVLGALDNAIPNLHLLQRTKDYFRNHPHVPKEPHKFSQSSLGDLQVAEKLVLAKEKSLEALGFAVDQARKENLVPPVDFVPGKEGNTIFKFKTVPWDAGSKTFCDYLDRLGIPYRREVLTSPERLGKDQFKYGTTRFEIDSMHKIYVAELADTMSQVINNFDRNRIGVPPAPNPDFKHIYIERSFSLGAGHKFKSFLEKEGIPFESTVNGLKMNFVFDQAVLAQHAYKINANSVAKVMAQPSLEVSRDAAMKYAAQTQPLAEQERKRSRVAAKNKRDAREVPTIELDEKRVRTAPKTHSRTMQQRHKKALGRA